MYVENALHRCDKFADNERPTLMQIYDALYQNVFDFMQLRSSNFLQRFVTLQHNFAYLRDLVKSFKIFRLK